MSKEFDKFNAMLRSILSVSSTELLVRPER